MAKFAFNIYGTLSTDNSPASSFSSSKSHSLKPPVHKFVYNCDREVQTLTDVELLPNIIGTNLSTHHVVIGGKNYLKLLMLDYEQTLVLNEVDLLDTTAISRVSGNRILNFNTIKANHSVVATGLVNGSIHLYQIQNNGESKLLQKFNDHKRCINSLDFYDPVNGDSNPNFSSNILISGSQDGTIKLWDLRQPGVKPLMTISSKSNNDSVRSCQFSNNSGVRNKLTLFSVHDSGTLNKYDLRSLGNNQVSERKWNFHSGPALSLHVHPEQEYVITCGRDQKVCVWDFGENTHSYTMNSPQYVVPTYGPVLKVRWCPYATPLWDNGNEDLDPLFKYDFACLYLNEDPTITVYNLRRKYVPKEIIQSYSKKQYQNFIWAKNSQHQRRIWTLSKGNQFVAECIDTDLVTRPAQSLNNVAVAWGNSIADIAIVSQESIDFESFSPHNSVLDFELEVELTNDSLDDRFSKVVVGSVPNSYSNLTNGFPNISQPNSTNASLGSSPIDVPRPSLIRASTGLQIKRSPSPSPSPQIKNSISFYDQRFSRPPLRRNHSQTTIDSAISYGSPVTSQSPDIRRAIVVNYASPYIIPLSLPLPLNDDIVFESLANNYLITIPDGFLLIDVCLLNAGVAASVNRFRDCQTWRILATGLGQHVEPVDDYVNDDDDNKDDNKSILSELGNIVGSYNSNSTSTTNYGEAVLEMEKRLKARSSSTTNLVSSISQRRNNSSVVGTSPDLSRSNSILTHMNNLGKKSIDNEHAVEDDDTGAEKNPPALQRHSSVPVLVDNEKQLPISNQSRASRGSSFIKLKHSGLKDLDNENENIINGMKSSFSTGTMERDRPSSMISLVNGSNTNVDPTLMANGSLRSGRSSLIAPTYGFWNDKGTDANEIDEPHESSSQISNNNKQSELTKAIHTTPRKSSSSPWAIGTLVEKALDYASLQGDIIFCSTLALLFYPLVDSLKLYFLSQERILEWLSLYIDIFHKKQLFVNAMNILNTAPKDLQRKLVPLYYSETLRFYCDNCHELLSNEETKTERGSTGFWFCEKCHSRQRNCVYCNEPCNGLNVVISLKCGHRGHFGCLKEWFIDEDNLECPGACGELLF